MKRQGEECGEVSKRMRLHGREDEPVFSAAQMRIEIARVSKEAEDRYSALQMQAREFADAKAQEIHSLTCVVLTLQQRLQSANARAALLDNELVAERRAKAYTPCNDVF